MATESRAPMTPEPFPASVPPLCSGRASSLGAPFSAVNHYAKGKPK